MEYRIEKDSMGEIKVPKEHLWGAQTQRSFENFKIGCEKMPAEIIKAFALLKKACAIANESLGKLDDERARLITGACDDILDGKYGNEFPLSVWQTGSGTQTNMNVNEVISHIAAIGSSVRVHPNDHVNMSQSSNDTFPTALHIAARQILEERVIPAAESLAKAFLKLEGEYSEVIKVGRTHMQDAVPLRFSDEISAWRVSLEKCVNKIKDAIPYLSELALGGTAVGTGLNCPEGFPEKAAEVISKETGKEYVPSDNFFHALSMKDGVLFAHSALKTLAADLFKIASDIRLLSCGPRCGIGEILIPENEPGSSIMPGKVNPTQVESMLMVAMQVMGNDVSLGMAAASGAYELNVAMPVIAYNFLQSATLLSDSMASFEKNCVVGIRPNIKKMKDNLEKSLMLVTALTPYIGYDRAAEVAKKAHKEGLTLKESALALGYMDEKELDEALNPEKMVK